MEYLNFVLSCMGLLFLCFPASTQKLSSTGRNVCLSPRSWAPECCSGWAQEGDECTIPLCEGQNACGQNEVCVSPGVCRCNPGFFGFECKSACPPAFWGSDCREQCLCHPHGLCDPAMGACTCFPNYWGNLCQNSCKCGRHGRCNSVYGNCTCEEGWWGSSCTKVCQCNSRTSSCDPATGLCLCKEGYWGQKCSHRCNCNTSPCQQNSGECQCTSGWWGPNCDRPCICDLSHSNCDPLTGECLCHPGYKRPICRDLCSPGYYGSGCFERCGHCEGDTPCSKTDGSCSSCAPGWNGTRCDQPCPFGYHGIRCQELCPHCRNGEPCNAVTGLCTHCEPGWTGPRCDQPCNDGTFGDSCRFLCRPCYHGHCDHVTGSCLCQPGFQGERCNSSCPDKMYGINCSSTCDCGDDACHAATGECLYSFRAGLLAGLLIPLLILILALLFCCCCCGTPADGKDRVAVGDGSTTGRMKHHVYTVLANMSSAMPCLTLWSSGLPRVTVVQQMVPVLHSKLVFTSRQLQILQKVFTPSVCIIRKEFSLYTIGVSHHDPELTFNHSFIEPPSGWVSDSFETDEDGEAVYCVPPREDIPAVAGGELQFQEMGSKCNFLSEPPTFSSEDMSLTFGIPRTSSIAKSKRPSVSFAEGTKFSPKERRGSNQELARKPKTPWGVLMLSSLQGAQGSQGQTEGETEEASDDAKASSEEQAANSLPEADSERYASTPSRTQSTVPGTRRNTPSNPKKSLQPLSDGQGMDTGMEKVSTVYVTVGKPLRASKADLSSEGPVQAMLRRLGSIQRQREEAAQPKSKGVAVTKPPRRKLGARASLWEQSAVSGQPDVVLRKPSRKKHTSLSSPCTVGATDSLLENSTPKRPLSSILKSVPESTTQVSGGDMGTRTPSESDNKSEAIYEIVAVSDEVSTSSELITNETLTDQEPKYENVYINHSCD
ncbi:scavenger receptor class F member 1 isoform X1 [Hemibagrus wyckioides]|uniref:scavenger receptor class F member 1 isoform X1 n=1 Tax=Hemibagrus wyckioides TaxID=337641 RepID=UPI00266C878D|nr:scavenger receptor class F member 1 isoform X1 [Hemibagrus wyckioides]